MKRLRRLRIVNETRYRTDDLRRFCLAGMKAEGIRQTDDWGRGYKICFIPARGRIHGLGSMNGRWVRMSIPYDLTPDRIRWLAKVFVHELGHNRGVGHDSMRYIGALEVPWVEGLEFRLKEPKPRKSRDMQAERQAHAAAMLATHAAKLKREQKLVKKWRTKVRYYDRVMEKRAASPPEVKESPDVKTDPPSHRPAAAAGEQAQA